MSGTRSTLAHVLPPPTNIIRDRPRGPVEGTQKALVIQNRHGKAPPYGQRAEWVPRTQEDFGDGGAFPEILVAQFPLEMGQKKGEKSNALAVAVDDSGRIKYENLLRQGQGNNKDKVIHATYQDLVPKPIRSETAPELQKPDEEAMAALAAETQSALQLRVENKIAAAMPVRRAEAVAPDQYIRYTPSQQSKEHNSGAQQRIIRLVEQQQDPMEPPKFRINKKLPKGPPSPPAPVMHSPPRKVTVAEQNDWKIPPCISNWKNAKGFTIPLDKRLAADGRGLQQVHINENFAKLAESLYIADRKARESVEMRAQLERRLAQKKKEADEERLRQLAQKAREERAGIRQPQAGTSQTKHGEAEEDEDYHKRQQLRDDRHRERARERNIQRAAPDKRNKLQRERERDISEKIALGMPVKPGQGGDDALFDQRLFNQSKGMDSGFGGGEDDTYNVYDKPWRSEKSLASSLYRPSKQADKDVYGDDLDEIIKTNRFVPDKGFEGADRVGRRDGPVQFEKAERSHEERQREQDTDIFGLDKFLTEAKKGAKRGADEARRSSPDRKDDRKKRR